MLVILETLNMTLRITRQMLFMIFPMSIDSFAQALACHFLKCYLIIFFISKYNEVKKIKFIFWIAFLSWTVSEITRQLFPPKKQFFYTTEDFVQKI